MTLEDIDAKLDDLIKLDHGLSPPELKYVQEMDSRIWAGHGLDWLVKARIRELWKEHCGVKG